MRKSAGGAFATGIRHSLGRLVPIEALSDTYRGAADTVAHLRRLGLEHYSEAPRSLTAMCVDSALRTLEAAGVRPVDVDGLVFSNSGGAWSSESEHELLVGLRDVGLRRALTVGLALQECSGCSTALEVASGLLRTSPCLNRVLVVLCGKERLGDRITPRSTTVYSDGAATCVVSLVPGDFEIVVGTSETALPLVGRFDDTDAGRRLGEGLELVRSVSRRLYRASGIDSGAIRLALGANMSVPALHLLAEAAGLPVERVYTGDVARYGHVFGCDNLIGLRSLVERGHLTAGDHVLLLTWSQYVVSGTILRYAA